MDRTYGTHKNLPGIYLPMLLTICGPILLWPPVIVAGGLQQKVGPMVHTNNSIFTYFYLPGTIFGPIYYGPP